MSKIAHLARLGLLLCLLAGCAPTAAPEQPTISGGYEFEIAIAQGPGGQGSRLSVIVHPPDPTDPAQVAIARQLEDEFLRRMQAHDLPR